MVTKRLAHDASNRSLRTILQGLAIDVLVAIALVLWVQLDAANAWTDLEWAILGFSILKSVVMAAAAYIMRAFLDPSGFPTPLPPQPQPQPADPEAP